MCVVDDGIVVVTVVGNVVVIGVCVYVVVCAGVGVAIYDVGVMVVGDVVVAVGSYVHLRLVFILLIEVVCILLL